MKKNEQSYREMWDIIKYINICIVGVPEWEESEKETERKILMK